MFNDIRVCDAIKGRGWGSLGGPLPITSFQEQLRWLRQSLQEMRGADIRDLGQAGFEELCSRQLLHGRPSGR